MNKDTTAINSYTRSEEIANTISHLVGVIMGLIVCTCFFIKGLYSKSFLTIFSLTLYFFGVVSSYLASSLYHACPARKDKSKLLLRKFDHAAIYWHIAGSYSPITLIALYNYGATNWAFSIFALVWISAIVGTVLTFRKIKTHSYLKTACYIIMGLSILIAIKPFYDSVGYETLMLVVLEGVSYIIGAVLYTFKKVRYIHFVFHVFVLLGEVFHMLAVWNILEIYL